MRWSGLKKAANILTYRCDEAYVRREILAERSPVKSYSQRPEDYSQPKVPFTPRAYLRVV